MRSSIQKKKEGNTDPMFERLVDCIERGIIQLQPDFLKLEILF